MRLRMTGIFLAVSIVACAAFGQEKAEKATETVVLDTSGYWRVHTTLRPPVVRTGGELKSLDSACRTALPPGNWMRADFDDSAWNRLPGAPFASHNSWSVVSKHSVGFITMEHCSPCLALIAMRGKFEVTDPKKVAGLTLSVAYRGGVVVTLNGTEIARGHLRRRRTNPFEVLATDYPLEAYLKPDGSLLACDQGEKRKEVIARWESRTRRLENVTVPARLLRKGANVLAIELHRAPYHEVLLEKTRNLGRRSRTDVFMWSSCGLVTVRLTAKDARGLAPNVVRPVGFRVWNSPVTMPDFDMDHGGSTEPLRPVRVVAARGGRFSGKVVVGSDAPIRGLRASVTDFVAAGGRRIAAVNVLIRYALPTSYEPGAQRRYSASAGLFDGLSETPPEEVPVREKKWVRGNWVRRGQPATRFGAVAPVWLTVSVPRDARPGEYTGTLTVRAEGADAVKVPVELKLCAFSLPPATAFRTTVDFIQSPESVAMYYKVPLWSDRHFKLIAESFKCLGEVGNRSIYIPLICRTNYGNSQSMVRWIRDPEGTYRHDFSIVERYVDLAIKHMGKPRMVVLYAWDRFLGSTSWRGKVNEGGRVPVSLLDPRTGRISEIELPPGHVEESVALWKPLGEGLTARLKARGLDRAMMLGVSTDMQPSPGVVSLYKKIFPGVPWMRHGHSSRRNTHGVPIAYQCLVWTPHFVKRADEPPLGGWNRKENWTQFCRSRSVYPVTMARLLGEMNIQGTQRGFGRIGLDFWPVLEDKRGRRRGTLQGRYPESSWRNLDWMIKSFVPPGAEGALSTTRIVMMREGLQECEARILIERALVTPELRKKLGDKLVRRCEQIIAERTRTVTTSLENHFVCGFGRTSTTGHAWWSGPGEVGMLWYVGSGWQQRSRKLFDAAAEIAKILGSD